jgi:selenide,water dikinase
MARSVRLGHCICDPKVACPCPTLRERDVCLCAGESLDAPAGPVRLTQMVEKPGCASKIDQAALKEVLAGLPSSGDPRVLVGVAAGDDAGVYKLGDGLALVQTVDVFTPSVDDPYTFGRIAAANSISDVYAMGGRPLTALSIIGFPIREIPDNVMRDILRGGIDTMAEAGVTVIGGHSINDREIKAGFAVTGVIDPNRIMTNAGAQPGDVLILTKPIGTGIIVFADQIDRAPDGAVEVAARSMASLNRIASQRMAEFGAHACTDITGFGLMGHLAEMAAASGVDVGIVWDDIPLLPGVLECLADGIIPGSVERNRESSDDRVIGGENVEPAMLDACFDAQTSGGLLIAIRQADAQTFLAQLWEAGVGEAMAIGKVLGPGEGRILVRSTGTRPIPFRTPAPRLPAAADAPAAQAPAANPAIGGPENEAEDSRAGLAMAERCEARSSSPRSSGPELDRLGLVTPWQSLPDLDGSSLQEQAKASSVRTDEDQVPCCVSGHSALADAVAAAPGISEARRKFQDFMKSAMVPGALDAHTKEAMAIGLSILAKCEPCTRIHIKKARDMGFSQDEIDEAVWMAIAFGGAPIMMFYQGLRISP